MDKLVLIDGNSIMNRAFYGIMGSKMLTTKDGKYTNAVYGFLAILFKLLEDVKPDYMAVTYECEIDSDRFQVKLATYDSDNGEEQLNAVIKSNPDIFTKIDIRGNSTYYCPGSKYDWSDCYAMVVDHKLLVVNIEKEYDQYIEWVLGHITLQ